MAQQSEQEGIGCFYFIVFCLIIYSFPFGFVGLNKWIWNSEIRAFHDRYSKVYQEVEYNNVGRWILRRCAAANGLAFMVVVLCAGTVNYFAGEYKLRCFEQKQDEENRQEAARKEQQRLRDAAERRQREREQKEIAREKHNDAVLRANTEIGDARRRAIAYRLDYAAIFDHYSSHWTSSRWSISGINSSFDEMMKRAENDPADALLLAELFAIHQYDACMCFSIRMYVNAMQHVMPGFGEKDLDGLLCDISFQHLSRELTTEVAARKYSQIRDMLQRMVDRNLPAFNAQEEREQLDRLASALDDLENSGDEDDEDDGDNLRFPNRRIS
jgi:hypothetical protein